MLSHVCDPDNNSILPKPWSEKLDEWKRGVAQTYPATVRNVAFYYETSGFDDPCSTAYREVFVESDTLPAAASAAQDYRPFIQHILRCNDSEWATAFDNMSGDTRLVIPMPKPGLNFTTMKHFVDNASHKHQQQFWMRVAAEVERWKLEHGGGKVYISTHGQGVAYFHLRICAAPKYYHTKWLV